MKFSAAPSGLALASLLFTQCGPAGPPVSPEDASRAGTYLSAVRDHLDTVLEIGRDHYGKSTPVFVDGLEILTGEPARWTYDQHVWILSNLANQQDLMRSLAGYSGLTGKKAYREAAVATIRHHFDHLKTPNGLLYWGGHTACDATTDQWAGRRFHWLGKKRSPIHELKSCYPDYELMWEVDPEATAQLIRTTWAVHIRNWSNLDFDRHGGVDFPDPPGREVWSETFDPASPVFFQSRGRTFVNTASDLFFGAGMLYHLGADEEALLWGHHLASRYTATRHPTTGLRGYQYSNLEEVDRARQQFGDLFPDSHVSEAAIFDPNALTKPLLAQLRLSETLGGAGTQFLRWAVEDLVAIGRHAYDPEEGSFKTLLLDGSDLTAVAMPRDGYFGPKGTRFASWPAQDYLLCYATAARLDDDPFLWEMARKTARHADLGDIGQRDGSAADLNSGTSSDSPPHLVALLELHRLTGRREFLDQACRVGDNILRNRFENHLFTPGPGYRFTRTSRPEPLALLHLAAALLGQRDAVPDFMDGHAYFACELKSTDPGYTFDHAVIYTQRRP
jgi:pectate lyase